MFSNPKRPKIERQATDKTQRPTVEAKSSEQLQMESKAYATKCSRIQRLVRGSSSKSVTKCFLRALSRATSPASTLLFHMNRMLPTH